MPRILVVDDEENIRLLMKEELEDCGYEVETAGSGPEALKRIAARRPDLVTVDVKMPEMSGLELLEKIREIDFELPVILCTAYGEYKEDLGSWGADAYVTKSHDLEEIKDEIRGLLSI